MSSDDSNYRLKIYRGPRNELQYMSVLLNKILECVMNCIDFFYGRSLNRNKIHESHRMMCRVKQSAYLKLGGLDRSLGSSSSQSCVPVSCDFGQGASSRWAISPSVKQEA